MILYIRYLVFLYKLKFYGLFSSVFLFIYGLFYSEILETNYTIFIYKIIYIYLIVLNKYRNVFAFLYFQI